MNKISVVVITKNEEKNLARCLASVKNIADEIIVLDSNSEDATVAIAESFGAKVFTQPFQGYVVQKNLADAKASNEWILSLDADEELSAELEQSIIEAVADPKFDAYQLTRLTNYCGSWIRHCGWYPDKKVRLFRKNYGQWEGEQIHEKWELKDKNAEIGSLKGDLLHYSYYSFSDHIKQIEKFTEITARIAVAQGKDVSLLKLWLGPTWRFFTDYIIKLGFLDGFAGYMVCKYSAWASFAKYSKVRQYNRQKKLTTTIEKRSPQYNYQPHG